MNMDRQTTTTIADALGWNAGEVRSRPVSGGSIADTWVLEGDAGRAFVKCTDRSQAPMLDAEHDGLERLAAVGAVHTPAALAQGQSDGKAWLALEYLELQPLDRNGCAELGRQLAELHQCRAQSFGLDKDNFIGATPQPNTRTGDWTEFLFEYRIGFQLDLLGADKHGFGDDTKRKLIQCWERRFPDYAPDPSLLHGDLWGGNAAMLAGGQPVVFDPAAHYGDRECDLAMADLFGGFDAAFFDRYADQWPLEPGWQSRRRFYKLYHLLNHANLFGGHYVAACRSLIGELIA